MIFDLGVAAIILISCIIAFLRGFIRETLTILGVVGGAFAAISVGPGLSPVVQGWFGIEDGAEEPAKLFDVLPMTMVADLVAYGGIFILVVIILSIISHMLSGWAKAIGLGTLDRSFGVLFGIARGVVLLALLYLPVYVMVDEETRDGWFAQSRTRPYVESGAEWAKNLLPESVTRDMEKRKNSDAGKAAREKLEQMDVLRREDGSATPETDGGEDGYRDEQRRNMNELIDGDFND